MTRPDQRGAWFGDCQRESIMNADEIEIEIRDIEGRLAHKKAAKPAHDHRGIYERELFELEETLDEKRRALKELEQRE